MANDNSGDYTCTCIVLTNIIVENNDVQNCWKGGMGGNLFTLPSLHVAYGVKLLIEMMSKSYKDE